MTGSRAFILIACAVLTSCAGEVGDLPQRAPPPAQPTPPDENEPADSTPSNEPQADQPADTYSPPACSHVPGPVAMGHSCQADSECQCPFRCVDLPPISGARACFATCDPAKSDPGKHNPGCVAGQACVPMKTVAACMNVATLTGTFDLPQLGNSGACCNEDPQNYGTAAVTLTLGSVGKVSLGTGMFKTIYDPASNRHAAYVSLMVGSAQAQDCSQGGIFIEISDLKNGPQTLEVAPWLAPSANHVEYERQEVLFAEGLDGTIRLDEASTVVGSRIKGRLNVRMYEFLLESL